jgi:hypothetical protein
LLAFARYRSIPGDFRAKAHEFSAKSHDVLTKSAESAALLYDFCGAVVLLQMWNSFGRSSDFGVKSRVIVRESWEIARLS